MLTVFQAARFGGREPVGPECVATTDSNLPAPERARVIKKEFLRLRDFYQAYQVVLGKIDPRGVPNRESSVCFAGSGLTTIEMDTDYAPTTNRVNTLFVLRHEFAHAAFGCDEVGADRFAAELAAFDGHPRDEVCACMEDWPGNTTHLPGPVRLAAVRRVYDEVVRTGRGKWVRLCAPPVAS
jgi:hypothetical protein